MDVPFAGLVPLADGIAVVRSEYYNSVVFDAVTIVAIAVRIVESGKDTSDLYIDAVDQTVILLGTVLVFLLGAVVVQPFFSTCGAGQPDKRRQVVELGIRVGLCVGNGVVCIKTVVCWIGLQGVVW